jgi:hypothetical protein
VQQPLNFLMASGSIGSAISYNAVALGAAVEAVAMLQMYSL